MKILLLTPWYPSDKHPNHGIFVRDQALVINQKHEVWAVSLKIDYSAFGFSSLSRRDGTFEGMRESRIVVKRSFPVFNQFNFFLRATLDTLRIARQFRPEIVHGNIGYPGAFCAWMISKVLSIPFVVTEHTRITNNFRSAIHRKLTLFSLRNASRIIAVSQWQADEIRTFVGKKPVVIPNVIHFEKFPGIGPTPDTAEFQIGFLGGMDTPVKGVDVLLRAIADLHGANFKLHIGGTGALLEQYKALATELEVYDKCIFYGAVFHDQVNDFMRKLHFFVNASRWETFGVAMVEALVCGLPVVATDNGGSREFITSENGLIVPVGDSGKLMEGIANMIRNYGHYDRQRISANARAKFSKESIFQRIDRVYTDAIEEFKA